MDTEIFREKFTRRSCGISTYLPSTFLPHKCVTAHPLSESKMKFLFQNDKPGLKTLLSIAFLRNTVALLHLPLAIDKYYTLYKFGF